MVLLWQWLYIRLLVYFKDWDRIMKRNVYKNNTSYFSQDNEQAFVNGYIIIPQFKRKNSRRFIVQTRGTIFGDKGKRQKIIKM